MTRTQTLQIGGMIAFRRKIYSSVDELQLDLDQWLARYNYRRPHQGKYCQGKTPMGTFREDLPSAKEELFDTNTEDVLTVMN